MLDREAQAEILKRVVEAAARYGLVVAPVGSVFFLFQGKSSLSTKDVDVVVHLDDGNIAPLEVLMKVGNDLGDARPSDDRASVMVAMEAPRGSAKIDLLRGKEGAKKGFLPRGLLRLAGINGRREGNILWYPIEFVILLKADAAIDRQHRAESGGRNVEENRQRAEVFRQDVFSQVQAALAATGLRDDYLVEGLLCLKKIRRIEVASLLEAASGGRLSLRARMGR